MNFINSASGSLFSVSLAFVLVFQISSGFESSASREYEDLYLVAYGSKIGLFNESNPNDVEEIPSEKLIGENFMGQIVSATSIFDLDSPKISDFDLIYSVYFEGSTTLRILPKFLQETPRESSYEILSKDLGLGLVSKLAWSKNESTLYIQDSKLKKVSKIALKKNEAEKWKSSDSELTTLYQMENQRVPHTLKFDPCKNKISESAVDADLDRLILTNSATSPKSGATFYTDSRNMALWSRLYGEKKPELTVHFSARPWDVDFVSSGICSSYRKREPLIDASEKVEESKKTTPALPSFGCSDSYCLNDGKCFSGSSKSLQCECLPGFKGRRCETEICANFCLNEGRCSLDEDQNVFCDCPPNYSGLRCEKQYSSGYIAFTLALTILVSLVILLSALLLLVFRRMQRMKAELSSSRNEVNKEKKKPRTFSGGSRERGQQRRRERTTSGGHQSLNGFCELNVNAGVVMDLEDCCQLTICEKPCVEAKFRKPTKRSVRKQPLIQDEDQEQLLDT